MLLRLAGHLIRCRMAFGQTLLGLSTDRSALVWEDVSELIFSLDGAVSIQLTRGRKNPLIEFEPAGVRILLDDADGRFDPAMTSGPAPFVVGGASQCQPNTPIWLDLPSALTGLADDTPLFLGVVEQFPAMREAGGWPTVEIQCWDMLRPFDLSPLRAIFPEQSTTDRVWATLDSAAFPEESVSEPLNRRLYTVGTGGASTCVRTQLTGHTASEHIANVMRTEGHNAFITIDKRGDFAASDRHIIFEPPFTDIAAVFGTGPGELPYMDIKWSSGEPYIYNQIECSLATRTGGRPVTIHALHADPMADFITLSVIEDGYLEGPIPAGASVDFGTGRVVTLRENARAGDTALQIVPIAQAIPACGAEYSPGVAIAADNASQMRYGKRRLQRSGLLCPSLATASAMAADLLYDFKDPHPRVESIKCSGIYSDELSEALLSLAVGNRVTIRDQPKYADEPIEMDMLIQGMDQDWMPGDMTATLCFSPVPQPREFMRLTNVMATTSSLTNVAATTAQLFF